MESWYFWTIDLLNLWDFQVLLDPRGILVFLDDDLFESLGFPSNFESAWNIYICILLMQHTTQRKQKKNKNSKSHGGTVKRYKMLEDLDEKKKSENLDEKKKFEI